MSFTWSILCFITKLLSTSLQVEVSPKMLSSTLIESEHLNSTTQRTDGSFHRKNKFREIRNNPIAKINSAKLSVLGPANRENLFLKNFCQRKLLRVVHNREDWVNLFLVTNFFLNKYIKRIQTLFSCFCNTHETRN